MAVAAMLTVSSCVSDDRIELDGGFPADLGVDGVCTDVPDVARAALGRAGNPVAVSPSWATWPSTAR